MRILIVNKFLHPNGGSETYIFSLGKALERLGHQVEYFGMEHEGMCVFNRVGSYTSDMDFHNTKGAKKLSYALKTIYSFEARDKIRKVLDDFKPDIVHLNNFNYQLTPSIILEIVKWRRQMHNNCKIYFTAHDYQLLCPNHAFNNPATHENCEKCVGGHFYNCIKGKCIHGSTAKSAIGAMEAYYWNKRGTYKYIDKIICCSEFMKTKMDTNPVFASKTIAKHNFIEGQYEGQRSEDTGTSHEKYVLYFGRYSEEKGIRSLITVCKRLSEVNFVFAGRGEYEKQIEELPNVTNVGFKTGTELYDLIRNAQFTVYPSEWYENCPFSIMESQKLGTPVLGADIGGIPELVEDGVTGWLFTSGSVDDLHNKIERIWNDPEEVDRIKANLKSYSMADTDEYAKWFTEI